jgi:signal transduction histidine kinase
VSFKDAFSKIVTNLISNSLTHGFENKKNGNISIKIFMENHNLFLIYSDNGKSIAKEHLVRIFEPFYTAGRGMSFIGLGLNIVYNLVSNTLKGQILCESEEGEGATFKVDIPMISSNQEQF